MRAGFRPLKTFRTNPPARTDQKRERECCSDSHLRAGLGVARRRGHGQRGFALHHGVGGAQRREQGAHDVAALDAPAQCLLRGHVRQHRGGVGDGAVSLAGQGVD